MHIALLNPQGNFDPLDSRWTEHPDFGGQLVYVKEIARSLASLGHTVDILTRRIIDSEWPEFRSEFDHYPGADGVRIVRIACGPDRFLPKEQLWPYLGTEWVPNIIDFYKKETSLPEVYSSHYSDGGLAAVLLSQRLNTPITFTGHSLSAQKIDKLHITTGNLSQMDKRFAFSLRLTAERLVMSHADRIITSTHQERAHQYGHRAYAGAVDVENAGKFAVVPPGVNIEIFTDTPGSLDPVIEKRIRSYLHKDIKSSRQTLPMILASSRLDAKKNLTGLVQSFGQDKQLQVKSNLAIVIRGVEDPFQDASALSKAERTILDKIKSLVEEYSLSGKITAFPLNSQQELAAAYRVLSQTKSVFVLPALYEPFGLAPLEAMSCGLPAVVTRNGGPSESMLEGDRVFAELIDPEDTADISRGILAVLESEKKWQQYCEAGKERVLGKYTWQQTGRGYEEIFLAILEAGHQPGRLSVPLWFSDTLAEDKPGLEELQALYIV